MNPVPVSVRVGNVRMIENNPAQCYSNSSKTISYAERRERAVKMFCERDWTQNFTLFPNLDHQTWTDLNSGFFQDSYNTTSSFEEINVSVESNNNYEFEDVDEIEHQIVVLNRTDIQRLVTTNEPSKFDSSNLKEPLPVFLPVALSCPITVQWLMDNYETAEDVSLPRSVLYYHYLRHCAEHALDPVNAASFGKLIRSVFLGLRTRRLGTRGKSKYHYCGIRLKPTSLLSHFEEEHHNVNGHWTCTSSNGSRRHNPAMNLTSISNHFPKKPKTRRIVHEVLNAKEIQQYLGDPSRALEQFPELYVYSLSSDGLAADDFPMFRNLYRRHCEMLLEDIVNFQLSDIEKRWSSFWRTGESHGIEEKQFDNIVSRAKLQLMCSVKEVQQFVRDSDYQFYQSIVGILLPDVLRPIPSSMIQAIRNFAKGLGVNLTNAMVGFPEDMINVKITVVNALAQTLRRYTSLNHLAQAARAILQNQTQINQMLTDLNRVDFHDVEEQASWVCGFDGDLVPDLEANFKATFSQQQSLEQWAQWLEGVVDRILRPHLETGNFVKAAQNFLLKWSFYSSLVIRDLTLRSAASFGSFHLLHLFYDEYMLFLVEQKVAEVTGTVPIAVIGKKPMIDYTLPSTGGNIMLDTEASHTQTLVNCYMNDHHHLNEPPSVTHSSSHNPSSTNTNGVIIITSDASSSGESRESTTIILNSVEQPNSPTSHNGNKSECKRRNSSRKTTKRKFLVV